MKPGVFIEAGVHGREWITPAVATWILKELVKVNTTGEVIPLKFLGKTQGFHPKTSYQQMEAMKKTAFDRLIGIFYRFPTLMAMSTV